MYILPSALLIQQFDMKTLIPIFFRIVNIIENAIRLFFKFIRQNRIDLQGSNFFRNDIIIGIDYPYCTLVVHIFEVHT